MPDDERPLAEFMGFFTKWTSGVDGISNVDIKIPNEEKYNAFPMTDQPGQMFKFVVYAPFGSRDPNATVRKEAIERVTSGLPIRGRMGDGAGEEPSENNTNKQGYGEEKDVKKATVVTIKRRTQ